MGSHLASYTLLPDDDDDYDADPDDDFDDEDDEDDDEDDEAEGGYRLASLHRGAIVTAV